MSVSEDIISDWFQLTISSWKKYRYDLRTLRDLSDKEIVPEAFAQIIRYGRPAPPDGLRERDFYSICLQDHNILAAMGRESRLKLLPLLIYVITHELVHIVRFYKFVQFFHADATQRKDEETRVHQLTYEILRTSQAPDLPLILEFYSKHREKVD
ncbi:MAG: hypothetical protein SV487_02255 [Thermodesulfobacteriota bacterium]|nr:hypothetical protein [Thermodesulfobacteriota bacterium]